MLITQFNIVSRMTIIAYLAMQTKHDPAFAEHCICFVLTSVDVSLTLKVAHMHLATEPQCDVCSELDGSSAVVRQQLYSGHISGITTSHRPDTVYGGGEYR